MSKKGHVREKDRQNGEGRCINWPGGECMTKQKKQSGFLERTARTLDLPGDVVAGLPRMELVGREEFRMENHRGILSCREEEIGISGGRLMVRVQGEGLELKAMSAGALLITGHVQAVLLE